MSDGLTQKQRRFVEEYLVDLNATQAAIRAGYSKKTARAMGCENLTKPDIAEAIRQGAGQHLRRTGLQVDDVLEGFRRIAFADIRDAVEWGANGVTLRDSSELTDEQAFAVAEVGETVTQHGGSQRIKFHSKTQALEALGRYFALFKDNLAVTNPNAGVVVNVVLDERPAGEPPEGSTRSGR